MRSFPLWPGQLALAFPWWRARSDPAWLTVSADSCKEMKALRKKGLNGACEGGRTDMSMVFVSSPGE